MIDVPLDNDFCPLNAWKDGQYDESQQSFDVFNARIERMLNAGELPLYPPLDLLDSTLSSIVMK